MSQELTVTKVLLLCMIFAGVLVGSEALPALYSASPSPAMPTTHPDRLNAGLPPTPEWTQQEREAFGDLVASDHISW
ncbi:MAG: hypothetical protein WC030_00525 [Candidatus Paceibacterota bacterium]